VRLGKWLLDLLYPPKCPFCGRLLDGEEEELCGRCQGALPWTTEEDGNKPVPGCDGCLSPLWYRDGVRDGMHRYKFEGARQYARLFGTLMAQCLSDRWSGEVDEVTWVPLSQEHLRKRGYDQAQLLAEQMGAALSLPVEPVLEKRRNTGTQSQMDSDQARRDNVRDAYAVLPGASVSGKRLVLVDDVATTGATLAECAACLRKAGAASVVAVTLARARE
jgi:ComF family protein